MCCFNLFKKKIYFYFLIYIVSRLSRKERNFGALSKVSGGARAVYVTELCAENALVKGCYI